MDNNVDNNIDENIENNIDNNQQKEPGTLSKIGKGIVDAAKLAKGAKSSDNNGDLSKIKTNNNQKNKPQFQKENLKTNQKNGKNKKEPGNMPDSVKQKKHTLNNKQQIGNQKRNVAQQAGDQIKAKVNEKVFRQGVKTAVDAFAPGTGEIAEKILDTPKGQPAVEAARAASNPVSGVKAGAKKLVEVIVIGELKKKLIMFLLPSMVTVFLIVFVVIGFISHFGDSQVFTYDKSSVSDKEFSDLEDSAVSEEQGGVNDELIRGVVYNNDNENIISPEYKEFYENIELYGTSNEYMIISVLTTQKDNDEYSKNGDFESDCTDNEISTNTCDISRKNINEPLKMKRYIKVLNAAIKKSNYDVSEGQYTDPGNTGSEFFRWLYNDFLDIYYQEYLTGSNKEIINKRKSEILSFIYSYYNDIKNDMANYRCASGGEEVRLTVFDDANLGVPIDKSKVKTNEKGWKFYEYEGKDYLVVATATNICIDIGCGYTDASETQKNYTRYSYITYYDYFDTFALTIDGKVYDAIVLDSCGGCQWKKETRGDSTNNRIDIWVSDDSNINVPDYGALNSTSCGITGDQIVLGNRGIYSASIFPIGTKLDNVKLTQGYLYDGGDPHGAIDLFCKRTMAPSQNFNDLRSFCTSLPIIAAHSGQVTGVTYGYCDNIDRYDNMDTVLPDRTNCPGNGVTIKIVDKNDPYYGYSFVYWHFESIDPSIKVGTKVNRGQYLGQMGSTGKSTGWHLHFAIKNASGVSLNQNDNILAFVATTGLASDGIKPTNAGPKF